MNATIGSGKGGIQMETNDDDDVDDDDDGINVVVSGAIIMSC